MVACPLALPNATHRSTQAFSRFIFVFSHAALGLSGAVQRRVAIERVAGGRADLWPSLVWTLLRADGGHSPPYISVSTLQEIDEIEVIEETGESISRN